MGDRLCYELAGDGQELLALTIVDTVTRERQAPRQTTIWVRSA